VSKALPNGWSFQSKFDIGLQFYTKSAGGFEVFKKTGTQAFMEQLDISRLGEATFGLSSLKMPKIRTYHIERQAVRRLRCFVRQSRLFNEYFDGQEGVMLWDFLKIKVKTC